MQDRLWCSRLRTCRIRRHGCRRPGVGRLHERGFAGYSSDTITIFAGFSGAVRAAAPRCAAFSMWHNISVVTNGVIWSTTLRANGVDAQITHKAANVFISVPIGNSTGTGTGGIAGNDAARPPFSCIASKCDVAEVILYDTVLSDSFRRSVEQYLAVKYGLPQIAGDDRLLP